MDKGSKRPVFLHEIKNFSRKIAVFSKMMTISTDLAISNSMSSIVPKYWFNWKIQVAIFDALCGQKCTYHSTPGCQKHDERQLRMLYSLVGGAS